MNATVKTFLSAALAAGLLGSADAATIILSDDFENGANNSADPSDFFTPDVGSSARTGYSVAYEGSKGVLLRASSGISLIDPLSLDAGGYSEATIDFQLLFAGGSRAQIANTQVYYSALGDFSDSVTIGDFAPADLGVWNAQSIAISDGVGGINFTDTAKIRIVTLDTASGDWSHVDNVVISGSGVVPEPGSLALMGLGGLCVLRRRRG